MTQMDVNKWVVVHVQAESEAPLVKFSCAWDGAAWSLGRSWRAETGGGGGSKRS